MSFSWKALSFMTKIFRVQCFFSSLKWTASLYFQLTVRLYQKNVSYVGISAFVINLVGQLKVGQSKV